MLDPGDLLDEQAEEVARDAGITEGEAVRRALRLRRAAASGATIRIVVPDEAVKEVVPPILGGTSAVD